MMGQVDAITASSNNPRQQLDPDGRRRHPGAFPGQNVDQSPCVRETTRAGATDRPHFVGEMGRYR